MNTLRSVYAWHLSVMVIAVVAIMLSFVFEYVLQWPPEWPLIAAIVLSGIPAVLQIVIRLIKREWGADALAAMAILTSVVLQQYLAAVIIILMIASGQALESFALRKASSVLAELAKRMPSVVHRKTKDGIEDVPLLSIKVDDLVVIYPHETCPVDGIVLEGVGNMDESYLTGEPYRISKVPGTSVISGAINGESVLSIRTVKLAADSRYASIVKVLQEAEQTRPSMRRLGDQIGAFFTPVALLLALGAWYVTQDAMRFLAVLVIATPCPLLIAIPITIISAISIAAKQAIIIKDPTVLERLPTCKTAIFDKTGTLTYGKPVITDIITAEGIDASLMLQYAASLERYSKHPLASAILQAAEQKHLPLLMTTSVTEEPGKGLTGVIESHTIHLTSRKKLLEHMPAEAVNMPQTSSGMECVVLCDHHFAALLRFHDQPRSESGSFISHLKPRHEFAKVILMSGDRPSEVNYLAQQLKITEVYASQSPEQKLVLVRQETKLTPTLFMGDGINDAPALTAATVGIAFGQYSNVTAEAAGAVIMENSLEKVDELIHLSLAVRRIALQSAIGGMLLSVIGMGFAAAGFITPVAGAILQEVIDILAIVNALRLIWSKHIKADFD